MTSPDISLRITLGPDALLGPGKADLLEGIRDTGSISAAGRRLGMSYKRAWYLLETLNTCFQEPVVVTARGGKGGGGASLTPTGAAVLKAYRRIEAAAAAAAAGEVRTLKGLMVEEGRD